MHEQPQAHSHLILVLALVDLVLCRFVRQRRSALDDALCEGDVEHLCAASHLPDDRKRQPLHIRPQTAQVHCISGVQRQNAFGWAHHHGAADDRQRPVQTLMK